MSKMDILDHRAIGAELALNMLIHKLEMVSLRKGIDESVTLSEIREEAMVTLREMRREHINIRNQ